MIDASYVKVPRGGCGAVAELREGASRRMRCRRGVPRVRDLAKKGLDGKIHMAGEPHGMSVGFLVTAGAVADCKAAFARSFSACSPEAAEKGRIEDLRFDPERAVRSLGGICFWAARRLRTPKGGKQPHEAAAEMI